MCNLAQHNSLFLFYSNSHLPDAVAIKVYDESRFSGMFSQTQNLFVENLIREAFL